MPTNVFTDEEATALAYVSTHGGDTISASGIQSAYSGAAIAQRLCASAVK